MGENMVDTILDCMASGRENRSIQRAQTAHRLKLASYWEIGQGDRILEIGCGQGDTTAVLAYLAGKNGFVHGVDVAAPDYGAPITLGDSIAYLQNSFLGERIQVHFETDILEDANNFPTGYYDCAVLSHCSWYFNSIAKLEALLYKLRGFAKKLCFAEWDANAQRADQIAHFLAVLIQAQYESYKRDSSSNIRTLLTSSDIKEIVERTGWQIEKEASFLSPDLQDGKWETDFVLEAFEEELQAIEGVPDKFKALLQSQMKLLETAVRKHPVKPLPVFTLTAK
ncbi:class I SAM-dependent methyltransferase [Virgibacillus halophilus]|uniref:Class I SAM-dependent methyltransferase n=1 Tax=Tigheibacillus halophilus TaxID=361280 RepID=A0ABU5C8K1_9BACI|nr:class I SAM-dependent methyltransferase [Virgibacillus halophilus]